MDRRPSEIVRLEIAWTWDGVPLPAAEQAWVELVDRGEALGVVVEAPWYGDPRPAGPPGPTPRLWEHEVVELFVAGAPAGPAAERTTRVDYLEVELGPHGHHLVLRFAGVRQVVEQGRPLLYTAEVTAGRWRGEASVPRAWLPAAPHRVAAFAVHGPAGERRHHASTPLPGAEPNFHQPGHFPRLTVPGRRAAGASAEAVSRRSVRAGRRSPAGRRAR